MKFFLLINVKMPTIVGILTFTSRKNSILSLSEQKMSQISWFFYIYEHLKFHAQLSWAWKKFYNLGARLIQSNYHNSSNKRKIKHRSNYQTQRNNSYWTEIVYNQCVFRQTIVLPSVLLTRVWLRLVSRRAFKKVGQFRKHSKLCFNQPTIWIV